MLKTWVAHGARILIAAATLLFGAASAAEPLVIENVSIIDVEDGTHRPDMTVVIRDDRIIRVEAAKDVKAPDGAAIIDGTGKFLIPGLWDMHVHAHRAERWKWQYPLFRAFGVTGVRDAGSHLGSALAAREWTRTDPLAPRIIWGSPIVDGAPPFNSFGLSAEDEASGRMIAREMARLKFDFLKVYDRLTPEAYRGLVSESIARGLRVEGHVPLSMAPEDVINAGQTLIDHLTLVLEACTPGMIEMTHTEFAAAPGEADSLALLMDPRFATALGAIDSGACDALFARFAEQGVWQVPTLVQMLGFFHADDPAITADARAEFVPPAVVQEWREWGEEGGAENLANGRAVFAAQMSLIRGMQDAGVGLLAGTDASNEPWVFAGASVHDEMALFVDAGLTPLEALQTATINPLRYLGRKTSTRVIAKGEAADLVLVDADPRRDIANTKRIEGVVARGVYYDRAALDGLLDEARRAAAEAK